MAIEPTVCAVIGGNIHKVVAERGGGFTEAGTAAAVVVMTAVVVAVPAVLLSASSPSSFYSLYQLMREQLRRLKPL